MIGMVSVGEIYPMARDEWWISRVKERTYVVLLWSIPLSWRILRMGTDDLLIMVLWVSTGAELPLSSLSLHRGRPDIAL